MTSTYSSELLKRQLQDAEEAVFSADWDDDKRAKHYAELRVIQLKNLIQLLFEEKTPNA